MKSLSVVVPCYNSEEYLAHCLESLLKGGQQLEIIIVNDGSRDRTAEIADEFQRRFPQNIKVIHQQNGGHGMAINAGLKEAKGDYVKIVDSDDWVDEGALKAVLQLIDHLAESGGVDMIINNYVYEKVGARNKKSINYSATLPVDRVFSWKEVNLPVGKYLLMHALIYRRQVLEDCQLKLPAHTFYVDNLYAFEPLPHVKRMYYLNVDFYRYFIGREDQSVNEKNMIARIDQQLFVNQRMVDFYSDLQGLSEDQQKYMRQYIEIITSVSSVMLLKDGSPESLTKKAELWSYIGQKNRTLYQLMRKSFIGYSVNLPGKTGRFTVIGVYRVLKKIYGFN